jgi:hypothetical protein
MSTVRDDDRRPPGGTYGHRLEGNRVPGGQEAFDFRQDLQASL